MSRLTRRQRIRSLAAATSFALVAAPLTVLTTSPASATPDGSGLVISELYGGGGNSGATLKADFVELYNPTDAAIAVDGLSVQYRSSGGTAAPSGITPLTGQVPAQGHYLIQEAEGAAGTDALPTPDATGTIAMSGKAFTALLVEGTEPVDPGTGAFAGSEEILDLVGVDSNVFETAKASAINNPTSASRNATGVDTDDNSADFTTGVPSPTNAAGESTGGGDEPGDPVDATIPDIQGEGATSPLEGKAVTTSGVVTAAYPEGGLYGFYLQVPGSGAADLDLSGGPASQGVFVRQQQSAGDVTVQPGDHVEVNGAVGEYAGATQVTVSDAASIETLPEAADPAVATSTWPSTPAERESLEGMLYRPAGNFTITETYATINYGELGLAKGNKPLIQWTDAARPGTSEAAAIKADNAKRGIVLDDGSSTGFKGKGDLTPPYISNDEPVRVDAKATFDEDVIFTEGGSPDAPTYRFQPLAPVIGPDNAASPATFANTRTEAPDEALINADGESDLKVASFNVLNYFTTLGDADDDNVGDNGCEAYQDRDGDGVNVRGGCDLRGAWDPEDFERQQTKIVAAINDLDADVVGLMEIENSAALGEDADEATETLVSALNDAAGSKVWAANPSSADLPPATDQDVITNAIIYKAASVERTGEARALGDQSAEGQAFGNAREPIAQAFTPKGGGEPFLFVVNHFKSKGSVGPFPGDEDAGDGQGNSNASRVKQAQALRDWLPGIEEEADTESVMLAGDFNSYTMEDPLEVLYDAGYADVEQKFDLGKWSYSYSGLSGSLDHVLVNEAAGERSTGADIWNINGGESVALEYSRWNYWATDFHTQTPYRSSDHDPVVLGLTAGEQGGEDGEVDLNLLGVNDFHGRINANTVKWAGTVEQLTKAAGDSQTLLVGAGDLIGASEFASAIAGDQPTIDMFNALGLDASAVGNHEFDKGYDDLTDRVIGGEGARNAKWDYLGANVYEKGTEEPALPEYSTYDVDGVTVGVIGVVTEETKSLVSPDGISMLDFGNPVEAVNRVSAELSDGDQANGEADVIVASFHAGAQKGEGSTFEDEVAKGGEFAEMVNLDEDVDVILNGHTHQEYAWDAPVGANGKTRPILQTGQYGDNVGQVTLTVDQETGDVVSYEAKNVARTETPDEELVAEFPRVAAIKEIVDEALAAAAEVGNEPVGEISGDITRARTAAGGEDRGAESTLGNLVGNALRDGLPEGMEADLGVTNPGGLRTDLLYAGDTADNPENTDGVVTYAEANSVLPFVNNVSLVDLTGAQLKSVLEQQWQPDGADRPFLALGTSDNVRVIQDPEAPRGERIVSVSIDGVELDPETTYTVSTFSFLATGGDNFTAFTEGASRDTGLVDRELWISYLKGNKPLDPDYARHQVVSADYPSTVSAGDEVSFTVSNLDLTSAGSPTNTDVEVSLVKGEETLDSGSFPVTDGSATVEFTADAGLEGQWGVVLTAEPSGTVVGPVSSGSDPDPGTKSTVTATVETFVYGAKGTVEAQVTSEGEVSGKVEVSEGDKVLGSGKVAADGSVSVEVDSVDIGAGGHQLSVDYLGNGAVEPSTTNVFVKIAKATPTVKVRATPAKIEKGKGKAKLHVRVVAEGVTPKGFVGAYVNDKLVTAAELVNGRAKMKVGPFDETGTHQVKVLYLGNDNIEQALGETTVRVLVKPSMKVKIHPQKVRAGKTNAVVRVKLRAPGDAVDGEVTVRSGGWLWRREAGDVRVRLPMFAEPGRKTVVVKYLGNRRFLPVKERITFRVVR